MTVVATVAKFLAAWFTQKTYRLSVDERRLIFGLSNAQAAATLAAVLVGYNVILGQTPDGEPIRLLNDSVLNGTIIMILVTCTIASFAAQKGGKNISLQESATEETSSDDFFEKFLISVSNPATIDELINLSSVLRSKNNKKELYALNVIEKDSPESMTKARKLLDKAEFAASGSDIQLIKLLRYDINLVNGITGVIKEQNITDLILGLHVKTSISESFLGKLTEGVLHKCDTTTFIYKPSQPVSTIKRHLIVIPAYAEKEIGFPFWLSKIWNISRNSGARLVFYADKPALEYIKRIHAAHPVEAEFKDFGNWDDFLIISRDVKKDDNLIVVLSRAENLSFHEKMNHVPAYLNRYFEQNSFIIVYPMQRRVNDDVFELNNPSLAEPIERLDELGKNILRLFRK
jgi:hypothetical protein